MRRKFIRFGLPLVVFAAIFFFINCEGPAGADAGETCSVCHNSQDKIAAAVQFASSQHKDGSKAVDYAGGPSACAQCHSEEGFIEYASIGKVEGNIVNPNAWSCRTCHDLHNNFDETDWALRLSGSFKALCDTTVIFDFANNSNQCANCHQSRINEPNKVAPGTAFKIASKHYGPHHGPQANVVAGFGFAEIAGSTTYPVAGSSVHFSTSCIGCHMGNYNGNIDAGGHTWNANLNHCNDCHGASSTNFDFNDVQTVTKKLLDELRDSLLAKGVLEISIADGTVSYHPVVDEFPMVQVQAFFNWVGLEEDRSFGVHNPEYINALLKNSIEALK